MITPERRQTLYNTMFQFMTDNDIKSVSLNPEALCKKLGIDLVPLSRIIECTGLTAADIFSIWGNKDGVIQRFRDTFRISYNDNAPEGRIRFTICEELSHMVYGHTDIAEFDMFKQQYAEDVYKACEEEARIGAGFLVCHPKFYYYYEELICPDFLAQVCHITQTCAEARCGILTRFKDEITSNLYYSFLPEPSAKVRVGPIT